MNILSALAYKWFGLDPTSCATCEVLREQLANSERERRELLHKLLEKDKPEPVAPVQEEELKPILPDFIPFRIKRQMMEAESRREAQLLKAKKKEMTESKISPSVAELEKELGIDDASQEPKAI